MSRRLRTRQPRERLEPDDLAAQELATAASALRDLRAFAPLCERYVGPIYGFCFRRLGVPAAAEDMTSQVFLRAIEKLHQFKGGSFKAWIFTIAENALRDSARASRPTLSIDEADYWRDPGPSVEEGAIAASDQALLRNALAQLLDEWRTVVELRIEKFSCANVARMLGAGRTEAWVRQVHHRAVQRLGVILTTAPAKQTQKGGPR